MVPPGVRPGGSDTIHTHGAKTRLDQFLQHCLNALMLGGTYALLGIGLTLIFGIMRVVNFTHGELYAFGAYCMYALVVPVGMNFFLALLLAGMAWTPSADLTTPGLIIDLVTRSVSGTAVSLTALSLLWLLTGRPDGAERHILTMVRDRLRRA